MYRREVRDRDWWVVGPVTVIKVDPAPGVAAVGQEAGMSKDVMARKCLRRTLACEMDPWSYPSSKDRCGVRIRPVCAWKISHGSVCNDVWAGFDSRDANGYDAALSLTFPYALQPNQSLISSISCDQPTPQTFGMKELTKFPVGDCIVRAAAVLTCLDHAPPVDAFRPPYAGHEKPIYQAKNIKWALLPNLPAPSKIKKVPETPMMLFRIGQPSSAIFNGRALIVCSAAY